MSVGTAGWWWDFCLPNSELGAAEIRDSWRTYIDWTGRWATVIGEPFWDSPNIHG